MKTLRVWGCPAWCRKPDPELNSTRAHKLKSHGRGPFIYVGSNDRTRSARLWDKTTQSVIEISPHVVFDETFDSQRVRATKTTNPGSDSAAAASPTHMCVRGPSGG